MYLLRRILESSKEQQQIKLYRAYLLAILKGHSLTLKTHVLVWWQHQGLFERPLIMLVLSNDSDFPKN